ncbi:hypothetical protein CS542_02040 [Pedobacter sp. IW39]|nr:hypothetical protein CS542_02040 [Pedobacter sp. IW39]
MNRKYSFIEYSKAEELLKERTYYQRYMVYKLQKQIKYKIIINYEKDLTLLDNPIWTVLDTVHQVFNR